MKKLIIIATIILSTSIVFGQKFIFVDTDYILSNIPAYSSAQDQLDEASEEWQKEIENLYSEIDNMYKNYQSEKVLLTEEMKAKRESEIINKEKQAKELQKKYFGREGDLFKKRQDLIKPLQDEIFEAIKTIAEEGNYGTVFDTANNPSILFSDAKYDRSDDVLEKLGYKN